MNNEILEEIKERYTNPPVVEVIDGINYALIDLKNLEWLIEQAQRSLYLEEREKEIIDINQHETQYRQELESINMELNQQNKRYREQLELIRKDTFYEEHEFVSVRHLIRKRVDKALEGESE